MAARADGQQELALRADLHHRRAAGIADPHIVVLIDGDAMGLVLMADHILADGADELVVGTELEQLRLSGRIALKGPEIALRIHRDARNAAAAIGHVRAAAG